jgi:hypothetical protein
MQSWGCRAPGSSLRHWFAVAACNPTAPHPNQARSRGAESHPGWRAASSGSRVNFPLPKGQSRFAGQIRDRQSDSCRETLPVCPSLKGGSYQPFLTVLRRRVYRTGMSVHDRWRAYFRPRRCRSGCWLRLPRTLCTDPNGDRRLQSVLVPAGIG